MTENKLVRGIGRWDLTAIAINTIIGTGIFVLPAEVFGYIGSWSVLAFVVCALITALIVLCLAEVASRFDSTGGMYLYAKTAFGPVVGFEVGWLYWVVRVATFAANCNALLLYIGFFYPQAGEGAFRVVLITVIVSGMTTLNIIGVRESAVATNVFAVGKLVPLIVFAAVGIFFVNGGNFNFSEPPQYKSFAQALVPLIYAFVGFEAAGIPAGESKDPKRDLPFALLTALAVCTLLFILIQIVAIGTLPDLSSSKRPLADAAANFLGPLGGTIIALGAIVSILGNLNGGFLTATRLPYAMAERRELPDVLAKTHTRFFTPYVSILVTGLATLVLTIQTNFYKAVSIAVLTRLLVYATTCVALPVVRRRKDIAPAEFRVPFGPLVALLAMAAIVWLLLQVKLAEQGVPILIVGAVGVAIYLIYQVYRKKRALEVSDANE